MLLTSESFFFLFFSILKGNVIMSAGKSCSRFITFVSFCHTMHLLRALCNWKVNPFAFYLTPWSIVWSLSSLMWPRVAAVMRNTFRSWTQNVRCYSRRWFLKGMRNLSKEVEGIKADFVLLPFFTFCLSSKFLFLFLYLVLVILLLLLLFLPVPFFKSFLKILDCSSSIVLTFSYSFPSHYLKCIIVNIINGKYSLSFSKWNNLISRKSKLQFETCKKQIILSLISAVFQMLMNAHWAHIDVGMLNARIFPVPMNVSVRKAMNLLEHQASALVSCSTSRDVICSRVTCATVEQYLLLRQLRLINFLYQSNSGPTQHLNPPLTQYPLRIKAQSKCCCPEQMSDHHDLWQDL